MKIFLPFVTLLSLILSVSAPLFALDPDDSKDIGGHGQGRPVSQQEEFDVILIGKCVSSLFLQNDFAFLNQDKNRKWIEDLFRLPYEMFLQFFEDIDPLLLPLGDDRSRSVLHRKMVDLLAEVPLEKSREIGRTLKDYYPSKSDTSSLKEELNNRLETFKFLSQQDLKEGAAFLEKLKTEGKGPNNISRRLVNDLGAYRKYPVCPKEDTGVPLLAQKLFTPSMSGEKKLQMIRFVLGIPYKYREHLVKLFVEVPEEFDFSKYKIFIDPRFCDDAKYNEGYFNKQILSLNGPRLLNFMKAYEFLKDHIREGNIPGLAEFLNMDQHQVVLENIPLFIPETAKSCANYSWALRELNCWFERGYGGNEAEFRRLILGIKDIFQPTWGLRTRIHILSGLTLYPQEERLRHIEYFQQNQLRRGHREPTTDEIFNNFQAPEQIKIFERGMDVHADDRDERTLKGLNLLMPLFSLSQEEIQGNVQAFQNFLEERGAASHNVASPSSASSSEHLLFSEKKQQLARSALLTGEIGRGVFGPFLEDKDFSLRSVQFSPFEIVAKFWHFSNTYSETGLSPEAIKKERLLCRLGMVRAFAESYDRSQNLICNQGKAQYLVISVLQGRLQGVEVDKEAEKLTPAQSLDLFFKDVRHQALEGIALIKAAQIFSKDPNVSKKGFLEELKTYIQNSEMFFTQFLLEVTPQILEGNYHVLSEENLKKAGEAYLTQHPDVSRCEFLEALEAYVSEIQSASA